jgi:hypothetical protein
VVAVPRSGHGAGLRRHIGAGTISGMTGRLPWRCTLLRGSFGHDLHAQASAAAFLHTSDLCVLTSRCVFRRAALRSATMDVALLEGSLFADRYRIDYLIGEGPRKQTYRAWDLKAHRQVALAVISLTTQPTSPFHLWCKMSRVSLSRRNHIGKWFCSVRINYGYPFSERCQFSSNDPQVSGSPVPGIDAQIGFSKRP